MPKLINGRDISRAEPLVKQLILMARGRRISMETVQRESGVSMHTVNSWLRGHSPRLHLLIAVAGALGYELKLVRREKEGT